MMSGTVVPPDPLRLDRPLRETATFRASILAIIGLAHALTQPAPLIAQEEKWPAGVVHPFFGLSLGLGTLPRSFHAGCPEGWEGHTSAVILEARGGVGGDRLGVELRGVRQSQLDMFPTPSCAFIGPTAPEGVHTIRYSADERDALTVVDVRLRHALRLGPIAWVLAAGPGWIWSLRVVTASLGSSMRFGRLVRGALDLDVTAYRTPWDEITGEWRNRLLVRETGRRRVHEWRSGVMLRLGIEVPVRR